VASVRPSRLKATLLTGPLLPMWSVRIKRWLDTSYSPTVPLSPFPAARVRPSGVKATLLTR
jgi:hypothetical protein